MIARLLVLLCFPLALAGQDLINLPEWARQAAVEASAEKPPAGADAWVLLQRTEFGYRGEGVVRKRTLRVVKILTDRGRAEARYDLSGLGAGAATVLRLQGWNLRPDGELTTLDANKVLTLTPDQLDSGEVTLGVLERVLPGSCVAFESLEELRNPVGSIFQTWILDTVPVRRWELELSKSVGWFSRSSASEVGFRMVTSHVKPWLEGAVADPAALRLTNLPALPRLESGAPHAHDLLPRVEVCFQDPAQPLALDPTDWNALAIWAERMFKTDAPFRPVDLGGRTGREALLALRRWQNRDLRYKQVYLTPDRGWRPAPPEEVLRLRSGDCKDLSLALIAAARSAGWTAFPVLARIQEGTCRPEDTVSPYAFNHALVALQVEAPEGWPAVVDTAKGKFLLVDPTDRFTPLGWLHPGHRGRQVLICRPDGGVWAKVPAQATRTPKVSARLEGSVDEAFTLQGSLELAEQDDALGLRSLALNGGAAAVRRQVAELLRLSPGADWTLEPLPDPLAEEATYKVRLTFRNPGAMPVRAGEWVLTPLGLPPVPAPIQRPFRPRQLPVATGEPLAWDYRATLKGLGALSPLVRQTKLETPLRSATWKAEPGPDSLTLTFSMTARPLETGFEDREAGVEAQRTDRRDFSLFLQDALAFRLEM